MRCVVTIGEGSSRLAIHSSVPPLSLSNMLITMGGGGQSNYLISSCSPCDMPSLKILSLPGFGSFHLVPFFPLVGFFVLLIIDKFSSFLNFFMWCNSRI